MVEDQFHIEMEEISEFSVERSADDSFWEDISYEEIRGQVLADLAEEKIKRFFEVVRNGGAFKLGDYFYRIKAG
jgi:malate/lactate dehydrogenase